VEQALARTRRYAWPSVAALRTSPPSSARSGSYGSPALEVRRVADLPQTQRRVGQQLRCSRPCHAGRQQPSRGDPVPSWNRVGLTSSSRSTRAFEIYDTTRWGRAGEDATLSMPPKDLWLQGPSYPRGDDGRGAASEGSRLLPVMANARRDSCNTARAGATASTSVGADRAGASRRQDRPGRTPPRHADVPPVRPAAKPQPV